MLSGIYKQLNIINTTNTYLLDIAISYMFKY